MYISHVGESFVLVNTEFVYGASPSFQSTPENDGTVCVQVARIEIADVVNQYNFLSERNGVVMHYAIFLRTNKQTIL